MTHLDTYGLCHVQIASSDLERSAQFYVDVLGLEHRGTKHGGSLVFLGTPGMADTLTIARANEHKIGVDHFGFMLKDAPRDMVDAVARINAAGGTIVEQFDFMADWPTVIFEDPDGHRVQI